MSWMEAHDAAAVAQVLAGDQDAFQILVKRYSHGVFRLAFRVTNNEQDAEDVVQETFLRAYRRLKQFESRSNFSTWLYRITVNCALDLVRKRRRHEEHHELDFSGEEEMAFDAVDDGPTPERLVLGSEVRRKVDAVLSKLSVKERIAFLLRHSEGMSIEEIGGVLGMRESATKNSIFRAVQKLRQELQLVMD